MGLFMRILGAGPALNRLARSCAECLDLLTIYRQTQDRDLLIKTSWLFLYGIINSIEKWHFNPYKVKIYVPNHPEFGRSRINVVVSSMLKELQRLSKEANAEEDIEQILDYGYFFFKYEDSVPDNYKKKFKP